MVRGTKRKIPIEKITTKESLATCFTKRSGGLYSKASQLCLLSGAQMAILATPSSSQSNVSFYSFGHSSVDSVVSAFLTGQRPVPAPVPSENKHMREDVGVCLTRKDLGLGFWWDDESLDRSENPEEIKEAIESMSSLLNELRSENNYEDLKKNNEIWKKDAVLHQGTHEALNQTLNLQSTSAICCKPDDCLKTLSTEIVVLDDNSPEKLNGFAVENGEEQDQILAKNNDLPAENLDYEEMVNLIDFDTSFQSLLADGFFDNDQEFDASLMMGFEPVDDDVLMDTVTDPNMFSDFDVFNGLC